MITSSVAQPVASQVGTPITQGLINAVSAAFDPASLFESGEQGGAWDFTNIDNLSTDTGGTAAVTAIGDPLFHCTDASGNGNAVTRNDGTPIFGGWPATVGSQVLNSPEFGTPADWTAGTGWSISSNTATKISGTGSSLSQSVSLSVGTTYVLVFAIKTRTSGTITAKFSGTTDVDFEHTFNAAGVYMDTLTAVTGNNTIEIVADSSFAGTVTKVHLYPAVTWAIVGAKFRGAERLKSGSMDFSGSNAKSYIVGGKRSAVTGNMYCGQLSQTATGSPMIRHLISATLSTRFSDGSTNVDTTKANASDPPETSDSTAANGGFVQTGVFDTEETTNAAESILRYQRFGFANSHSAGPVPTTSMSATTQAVFGAWHNSNNRMTGIVQRGIAIDRVLSGDDLTNAEKWVSLEAPKIAVVGDSIYEAAAPSQGLGIILSEHTGNLIGGVLNVANVCNWGDDAEEQLVDWNALNSLTHSALDAVIIGVGHNDVRGKLDSLINAGDSYAVAYGKRQAEMQELIDQIKADVPSTCKLIGVQLIPCKGWLDGATNAADCYQAWQDWNEDLLDGTFTNLDAVVTGHVALLNDGSDNLNTLYNPQDDGIHPCVYGRWIIAQEIRKVLVNQGLVKSTITI